VDGSCRDLRPLSDSRGRNRPLRHELSLSCFDMTGMGESRGNKGSLW